jgi:tetratricopeptide (TPR) repeat protein
MRRRALEEHPGRGAAAELLGDALSQKGLAPEALEAWLGSLKVSPSENNKRVIVSKNWTRDGQLAEKGGDRPRAERYFRRAAALDSNNVLAKMGLARAFVATKEWSLARVWAQKVLALAPDFPEALAVLRDLDEQGK